MARRYSMHGVQGVADRAVELACSYLRALEPTSLVHDVQGDPRFQDKGVDLLWDKGGQSLGVEVKGDRQRRRGNYFFELVSNLERNTPGCFLYSSADLYLYVFVAEREIHALPMPGTRQWFLQRAGAFPLKHTQTRIGGDSYTTVGAIVPIRSVLEEVPGAQKVLLRS